MIFCGLRRCDCSELTRRRDWPKPSRKAWRQQGDGLAATDRVQSYADLRAGRELGGTAGLAFFEVMMRTLSPEFDFILFDSAPLLAAADARLLELHTDATLIVIREGGYLYQSNGQSRRLLNEERLLGAVLNRVVT